VQPPLTDVEARVVASLIEKEATTPDAYPLSLGALLAACNQSSNREPVMRLDESAVADATTSLRRRSLLRAIQPAGSRVTKYQHLLADALDLDRRELAVLGVLALRGAQTVGELHVRTARLADFADLAAIEATLDGLAARTPEPLVARLPRRPGQRELRYAHLLCGEPAAEEAAAPAAAAPVPADDGRVAALEQALAELRGEVASLRRELAEFRAQFQ
jgi:uncharacterized protein YceH (UPF0502 family)